MEESRITGPVRKQPRHRYQLMRESFPSDDLGLLPSTGQGICSFEVPTGRAVVGTTVEDLLRPDPALVAVLRDNTRIEDVH
jgi:hypothetical protein